VVCCVVWCGVEYVLREVCSVLCGVVLSVLRKICSVLCGVERVLRTGCGVLCVFCGCVVHCEFSQGHIDSDSFKAICLCTVLPTVYNI